MGDLIGYAMIFCMGALFLYLGGVMVAMRNQQIADERYYRSEMRKLRERAAKAAPPPTRSPE